MQCILVKGDEFVALNFNRSADVNRYSQNKTFNAIKTVKHLAE